MVASLPLQEEQKDRLQIQQEQEKSNAIWHALYVVMS
jgi:hypothetical protein